MDCGAIPDVDYGQFSESLHAKALAGAALPISGTIEFTQRCNLRCVHCYVPCAERRRPGRSPTVVSGAPSNTRWDWGGAEAVRAPLSGPEIRGLLDVVSDAGCLWLLITGGEPLIRPDFLDLYGYAKRKGFLVTLFTNATLVTPRIADCLAEYPPFSVEVTLYGATAGTYESITGVRGSYQHCLRGIELLAGGNLPLTVKTMALRRNITELGQIREFAVHRGFRFRWDPLVHPQLTGQTDPLAHRLAPEEIVELEMADEERLRGHRQLLARARTIRVDDRLFTCGAGLGNFHIDAFGYLRPCGFVPVFRYDLRQGSFGDGYYGYFPYVRDLRRQNSSPCQHCTIAGACPMCVAWEHLEGNGREGPVQFVHRYFELLGARLETTPEEGERLPAESSA